MLVNKRTRWTVARCQAGALRGLLFFVCLHGDPLDVYRVPYTGGLAFLLAPFFSFFVLTVVLMTRVGMTFVVGRGMTTGSCAMVMLPIVTAGSLNRWWPNFPIEKGIRLGIPIRFAGENKLHCNFVLISADLTWFRQNSFIYLERVALQWRKLHFQRGSSLSMFFVWSDPQRRGSSLLAHVLQIFPITLAIIHRDHVLRSPSERAQVQPSLNSYEWPFLRSLRFFKRDWIRDPHLFGVINHQHEFQ